MSINDIAYVTKVKPLMRRVKRAINKRFVARMGLFLKKRFRKKPKTHKGYAIYDTSDLIYATYPLRGFRCSATDTAPVTLKSYRALLDRVAGKLEHNKHFKEAFIGANNIFLIEGWRDANPMIVIEDEATARLRTGGLKV